MISVDEAVMLAFSCLWVMVSALAMVWVVLWAMVSVMARLLAKAVVV
jgi:hypothetical protein